jgi:hypothetical protein
MWYALMDKEPMLLGTDKKGGDVYGEYLQAVPMCDMQLHARVDDLALDELYTDYPFNWMQQLVLFHLGDAGILADVYCYQQSYLKLKLLKNENECLSRILLYAQGEHEQHNKEVEALLDDMLQPQIYREMCSMHHLSPTLLAHFQAAFPVLSHALLAAVGSVSVTN